MKQFQKVGILQVYDVLHKSQKVARAKQIKKKSIVVQTLIMVTHHLSGRHMNRNSNVVDFLLSFFIKKTKKREQWVVCKMGKSVKKMLNLLKEFARRKLGQ